jgi:potassium voltage-gated channel Eag-related subfamily H protein 7|eukprot:Stramenopile-MAST_4_protein_2951
MGKADNYKVVEVKPKGGGDESKSESKPGDSKKSGNAKSVQIKKKKSLVSRNDSRQFTNPDQLSVPKDKCVINPKKTGKWDAVMMICLIFTALVTPYEVAYLDSSVINALWVINMIINVLFLIDMVFNFFMAYFDDDELMWIASHTKIARRYLGGWFLIDFVSIFPFDYVFPAGGDSLKALRVIRLLRLAKLLRVFRASRMLDRWQNKLSLGFGHITMIKFLISVIIICHWLACFWRMIPDLELHVDETGNAVNWLLGYGCDSGTPAQQYLVALYFSTMTLTTIGYGDVGTTTDGERGVATFYMLVGAAVYAYCVGVLCGVVSGMDQMATDYNNTMDQLQSYLEEIRFPNDKKPMVREYFQHCRVLRRMEAYQHLLGMMSPALRGQVANHMNGPWVRAVYFFNPRSARKEELNEFVTEVSMKMTQLAFIPNESVVNLGDLPDELFIVSKGVCSKMGRIISAGNYFGEDFLLENGKRMYVVRALTYLDVQLLTRVDLYEILNDGHFTNIYKAIRRETMKQAFRANFLSKADALAAWLRKSKKESGQEDALTSKMKELDYWKEETKDEKAGTKNLFASAGTPAGTGRTKNSNDGVDMKKMARTLSTRFQEVIDLVRNNQEVTDQRLDQLEKMIREQQEANYWTRTSHLLMGFAVTIGALSYLIASKFS